jgi:hypothetical protein
VTTGDSLQLGVACNITVTDAAISGDTYTMTFTLAAMTTEQRNLLAINGESVSLLEDAMVDQIQVGGVLQAGDCFSPISVGAPPLALSLPPCVALWHFLDESLIRL